MTNTEEKQARSKQIPQAEQPNTTATAEKLELETGKKVVTDSNFLPNKQPKQIKKKINYIYLKEISNSGNKMVRKKFTQINLVKSV